MKSWIVREFFVDPAGTSGRARTIIRRGRSTAVILWALQLVLALVQGWPASASDVDVVQAHFAMAGVLEGSREGPGSPHDAFLKLADYARKLEPNIAASESSTDDVKPPVDSDEFFAAHPGHIRRSETEQPELKVAETSAAHAGIHDKAITALIDYAQQIIAASASSTDHVQHPVSGEEFFAAHPGHIRRSETEQPELEVAETSAAHAGIHDKAITALIDYAQQTGGADELKIMLAEAGKAKAKAQGQTARPVKVVSSDAMFVGAQVCQSCHLVQAAAFNQTLMGKIFRNPRDAREKTGCEACHGPGSLHLKAVGCASCHGDGGITKRPGTPSLAGQDPAYLVPAMKAYVSGQRHHDLMRVIVSGIGDAELNDIAVYYAGQPAARAQTPLIGDPSAGRGATALCAGCHGEQGVSVVPAFPNLAGQDARYLADALNEYKHGSRSKVISCAACHGAGGISKKPGIPNLAGQDPATLVAEMKAYAGDQRSHDVMKALLSGVEETELNKIAVFYARQTPARAQTPLIGDPSAGKAAAAACAGCHGQEGVSSNPMWPSLAGQDARYLADEIKAYKTGSRNDATMKALVASLDDRTINDIASYYASLQPAKPTLTDAMQAVPSTREPVVVRNGFVANLDERTINNIASYYASLVPAQSGSAKHAPARAVPARVGAAANTDGRNLEILSFRLNDKTHTVDEFNDVCLGCHEKGNRTLWRGSTHDNRGVACVSCHTVMRNVTPKYQLAQLTEMDTCFQCHKNQRAQMWQSSHMPVREGKVTCSSCHNPHGSFGEALLKTATVNDTCYKCHAEKRGPFLWEHAPVRENCLNCHNPHGSMQDAMLKVSRPRLCQQCHTAADHPGNPGNPRAIYSIGAACSNCHVKIHGSNSPAGAVFVR